MHLKVNFNIYIYKDAQEGAPDVALKGTLLVALELHLFMQVSMYKVCTKWFNILKNHEDAQKSNKKDAFDVALDDALEGAFVSAI